MAHAPPLSLHCQVDNELLRIRFQQIQSGLIWVLPVATAEHELAQFFLEGTRLLFAALATTTLVCWAIRSNFLVLGSHFVFFDL